MARPAHPRSHDARLGAKLEEALDGEVLLPCPDLASAKLVRSRLRELIRAHKEWETGEFERFKPLRFRIHQTHLILPIRENYLVDSTRFPYTLALDSRDVMDEVLGNAASSDGYIPLTRNPQDASGDIDFGDDDEDDVDPNAYAKILERMNDA